jgi:hypothetical protein
MENHDGNVSVATAARGTECHYFATNAHFRHLPDIQRNALGGGYWIFR